MFEKLKDIAPEEFDVKIKKVKREIPLTFEELFGVGTKNMDKDKIILTKEEYDDLCANYDKVYEQAKADILGNMSDGGTSCHWCIDENRRIGKEEALNQIWHKVADNDLPECNKLVLCALKKEWPDEKGYIITYAVGSMHIFNGEAHWWSDLTVEGVEDTEIIAWMEIPTYED